MYCHKFKFFVIAFLLTTIHGCSCNKVKLPKEDRTPPNCRWFVKILDLDKTFELPAGTITMKNCYSIQVSFKVTDDGGVSHIKVKGLGKKAFSGSNAGTYWLGPENHLEWSEEVNFQPDAQEMVQISATLYKPFDFTPIYKSNGGGGGLQEQVITSPGGFLDLQGSGRDYFGSTITSNLRITTTPKLQ